MQYGAPLAGDKTGTEKSEKLEKAEIARNYSAPDERGIDKEKFL